MRFHHVFFVFCVLLGACAVGPDYVPPSVPIQTQWAAGTLGLDNFDSSKKVSTQWWEIFRDPFLTDLLNKAERRNFDLRIARNNIIQARALRSFTQSSLFPGVDANGKFNRLGVSKTAGMPLPPGQFKERNYYEFGFDASWELDFFGGNQRAVEAATARWESSIENARDVLLIVLAETTRSYIELRGAQRQYGLMQEDIVLWNKQLELTRLRVEAGEAASDEEALVLAELLAAEARLPGLQASERAYAYRLAFLTGDEPAAFAQELLKPVRMSAQFDPVPSGLPSELLRRRPDLRRAERQLAAETADIGVAVADLFPRFFLTGGAGLQTLRFSDILRLDSSVFSLGPQLHWPLFQGGAIRSQIHVEKTQALAAAMEYEKAVLQALHDVETALVRYGKIVQSRRKLQKVTDALHYQLNLTVRRYQHGEDNYFAVLQAKHALNQHLQQVASTETNMLLALTVLYKALGGGWEAFSEKL